MSTRLTDVSQIHFNVSSSYLFLFFFSAYYSYPHTNFRGTNFFFRKTWQIEVGVQKNLWVEQETNDTAVATLWFPRFSPTPWNLFELLTPKFFSSLRAFSASRRPSCPWFQKRNLADFANARKTTKQGSQNELGIHLKILQLNMFQYTNLIQWSQRTFRAFVNFRLSTAKKVKSRVRSSCLSCRFRASNNNSSFSSLQPNRRRLATKASRLAPPKSPRPIKITKIIRNTCTWHTWHTWHRNKCKDKKQKAAKQFKCQPKLIGSSFCR